jgi:hypothetical protein
MNLIKKAFQFNPQQGTAKLAMCILLTGVMFATGCSSNWINVALQDLPILVQIATSILGIVNSAQGSALDPAAQIAITAAGAEAKADLLLVQQLVNEYQAATKDAKPGIAAKIDAALDSVQQHLGDVLTVAHIKDPTLRATITAAVGLAISTVLALKSMVPTTGTQLRARKATRAPNPGDLKSQFNDIVAGGGYAQFSIQ